MMDRYYTVLIISDVQNENYWKPIVDVIRRRIGTGKIVDERIILQQNICPRFDLSVVDASNLARIPEIVQFLHLKEPGGKIIIVSTTPTWKKAREAFQIGATDYIQKRADPNEMASELEAVLSK